MDFFRYPLDPQKVKESRCLICDPVRVVLPESFNDKFTLPLPSSEREGTVNGVDFDFQGRQYTNTLGSEIGICLEGSGLFYAQGRFFRYNPGDAVYSFADLGRSWQSDAGVRSTWYFMPINLLELMKEGGFNFFRNALNSRFPLPSFPFLLTKAENYAGNHLIWRIFEECLQKKEGYGDRVSYLVAMLTMEVARLNRVIQERREMAEEELLPAVIYMIQHLQEPIGVQDICKACNKSYSTLRLHFLKKAGCTPLEYLNRLRMEQAVTMLEETDRKIAEVAAYCGFSTLSSFNRQFLACKGMSPRAFRLERQSRKSADGKELTDFSR
ncbi:MAG: helix-turn-helix transcriptional regulator [Clostridia bacterium]|nr:helix-turn-helix transcriptional regulator [Clostridia bacterium]